ncbi:ABC transporter substrate-binding protein [Lactonifactor longoviformis]|uniref:ABC-type glycerol-3-phosphate transport system, substrate-binding protein n=1 Tax=Lactonifactor longoviformis DSM 17459 TaxID=1122155 RepID=A0A1M4Y4Z2_9CLOT|nr:extracellular solute-binding protein [Lactonifactor longoviformis]SHF00740.1 ABC-type glycerol-3-phosphate transport system, substrate-binding protein [Lactonifactor longoviformis DSM 17459]
MKRKKVLCTVLAAMMIASMATGCGGNDDGKAGGTEKKSEGEKVTLTVLAGQSTTDAGIEDMIDEALAEKYPNIELEWECVDWGNDFQPKMQQYMQSGLPDIMIGKAQDVSTYAPQGVLGEIDSKYVDRGLDAASENVTIDGKTYGLVYNALYQGVYYNKTMFKENGWEVPKTQEDLQKIIDDCKAKGITPFASHMVDTWSIGNVTMQFAMNDVFNNDPTWGDKFRDGKVSFSDSKEMQTAYEYNKLIYDNTFPETFSTEQTDCDAKMVQGEAAMKVSGSWSIQNFLDIDENFEFGIFPFPNQTGDSKLIFEPNITVMTSKDTKHQEEVNQVLDLLTSDKDLAVDILDYTKTASMLKDVTPTFKNPSQEDIDKYAEEGNIVDVTLGNNQLVWGGFQEENAKDIASWLQGDLSFEDCLKASDGRVGASSAN